MRYACLLPSNRSNDNSSSSRNTHTLSSISVRTGPKRSPKKNHQTNSPKTLKAITAADTILAVLIINEYFEKTTRTHKFYSPKVNANSWRLIDIKHPRHTLNSVYFTIISLEFARGNATASEWLLAISAAVDGGGAKFSAAEMLCYKQQKTTGHFHSYSVHVCDDKILHEKHQLLQQEILRLESLPKAHSYNCRDIFRFRFSFSPQIQFFSDVVRLINCYIIIWYK